MADKKENGPPSLRNRTIRKTRDPPAGKKEGEVYLLGDLGRTTQGRSFIQHQHRVCICVILYLFV